MRWRSGLPRDTWASVPREEVEAGLVGGYRAFAELVGALGPDAWGAPTRCTGWQVRDVAAHVLGQASDLAAGRIATRTPDAQAAAGRAMEAGALAAALRTGADGVASRLRTLGAAAWDAPSPAPPLTVGEGMLWLWSDAYVHADDVLAALGLPPRRGPGLAAAALRYAMELDRRGWSPLALRLDGLPEWDLGGRVPTLGGDPHRFVLAAAGRLDAAALGLDPTVDVYREA